MSEVKWPIEDPFFVLDPQARAGYWEDVHAGQDYDNVYSLTEDEGLRLKIVGDLRKAGPRRILIPGCGRRVELQRAVIEQLEDVEIVCVDFPGVVEMAEARFAHPQLKYVGSDINTYASDVPFDAVVHVTSVVSELDSENRHILKATSELLRPGGLMIGVFPTVFAMLDVSLVTGETWRSNNIDLPSSSYEEPKQGVRQIFYTPLRLRRILIESGVTLEEMTIFFNDSEHLRLEGAKQYNLHDEDAVLYHLYCVAVRTQS